MSISELLRPLYDEAMGEIRVLAKETEVGEGGIVEKTYREIYFTGYLDAVKAMFVLCHTNGILDIDLNKIRAIGE